MQEVACTNCGGAYPEDVIPYKCPTCGGVYDFKNPIQFDPEQLDLTQKSIWRYRASLGLPQDAPPVTLGEGNTPLVFSKIGERDVGFKLEYLNPTGSFKDRGIAPLTSFLVSRGVAMAVEDSSGNAGASFAAYAARAGIRARIFVPDYAAGPKRAQIAAYGAELVRIAGPRSNASLAVQRAAEDGAVYASHVHQPFGLMGMATVAYEIVSDLGTAPGTVITPVGQGSLLLGVWRGFLALREAGVITEVPRLVGVQAAACAPLWAVFTAGAAGLSWVTERETAAEGVRIKAPTRGDQILQAVADSRGTMVAVEEKDILPGRDRLAGIGYYVEPTSAIVWDGLHQVLRSAPDPIVVLLTGSGYKSLG
jgi:threonine synthase